jgi:recombinational DNA repair ATPase RecF
MPMMQDEDLVITKLEGYSGIRLKNNKPLVFKPGINLLVGKNGCGKTNLLRLIQLLATNKGELKGRIESSYFIRHSRAILKKK